MRKRIVVVDGDGVIAIDPRPALNGRHDGIEITDCRFRLDAAGELTANDTAINEEAVA